MPTPLGGIARSALVSLAIAFQCLHGDFTLAAGPSPPRVPARGASLPKTYMAAPQVLPSGFELIEEVPILAKNKIEFQFQDGLSPVPAGTILFECDPATRGDATLRKLVAYMPTDANTPTFTPVFDKDHNAPIACGADIARQCFAVGDKGVLRPLKDKESVAVGSSTAVYELLPGNLGRFVSTSLSTLVARRTGTFLLEQLLGMSVGICEAPSPNVPVDFPALTGVEQVDPFSHSISPVSSLRPAAHLPAPLVKTGEEVEVCTVARQDLVHDGDDKVFLLRPRSEASTEDGAAFPVLGGPIVCMKSEKGETLAHLDQNIPVGGGELASAANLLTPVAVAGKSQPPTCDLGPDSHTVATLLLSVSTDPSHPVERGADGNVQKTALHHFTAPYVPSVNSSVIVEIASPVSWEPQALKAKCKIGASLAALQPHLLLKSEVPHGTPVECEVVHLAAFHSQGQLLMIAPGQRPGQGARPLLLPPGSILLNQEDGVPEGVFQVLVYDLWEADGLRAVLKQLYYRGKDLDASIPVYVQTEGSRTVAVGSFHRRKRIFTPFNGIDPTERSRDIETEAPFYYTSFYGLPVDVGFTNLKSGVGFSVKRTPEALLFLEDLLKTPLAPASQAALADLSPFTREAEDVLSRLHRLKGHFSRQKYAAHAPVVIPMLNGGLAAIAKRLQEADRMFLTVYPRSRGTRISDVQVRLNYLDNSQTAMTVILRLPMRLNAFLSATHLAPQVHRNLALLLEVIEDPHTPLEALLLGNSKFGVYAEAVRIAVKLLRAGHCRACADDEIERTTPSADVAEGRCGRCSARRMNDIVILDLHDIQPSAATMPTTGTWMKWNDETFLISLPPDSSAPIYRRYGIEFDLHTTLDLPSRLATRFKQYAGACMRSHLLRMLEPLFENPGLNKNCPALSKFAAALLRGLPFSEAAPLLESSKLLLQHVVGACNIPEASWAIDKCLDDDGDLLGYRRMPAMRPLGRTRLANIMRGMMSPVSSLHFLTAMATGEERIRTFPSGRLSTTALELSHDAQAVLRGTGDNPPPLPSYVFGPRSPLGAVAAAADELTGRRAILLISSFSEKPIKVLEELLGLNPRSSTAVPPPDSLLTKYQAPVLSSVDRTKSSRGAVHETAAPILSSVKRTIFDRQPRQSVQDFISSCFTDLPEICAGAYNALGWPLWKVPSDDKELHAFDKAVNEMRVRLNREHMPERLRSDIQQALSDFDALPAEPEPPAPTPEPPAPTPDAMAREAHGQETLEDRKKETDEHQGQPDAKGDDLQAEQDAKADDEEPAAASTSTPQEPSKQGFTVFELPPADSLTAAGSRHGSLWGQGQMPNAFLGSSQAPTTTSRRLAWPYINKMLTAKNGPMTRMPSWVRTSDTCSCLDPELSNGCRMDSVKSTTDVVFRLSLLVPPAVERYISSQASSRQLEPPFAAFCASVGIFVSSWQQHLVAGGHEEKGGNMAHSTLAARLAQGHKYLLKNYSDDGSSDHKHWRERRRRFIAFQKHYLYRQCRALMVAAGNVAYAPYKSKSFPAASLYGGIANTLDTPFTDKERALHGLTVWSERILRRHRNILRRVGRAMLRRPPQAPKIGALFAAMHMSHLFKDCFNMAGGILLRTWYYMHVEGSKLLAEAGRLPGVGSMLSAVSFGFAGGVDVRDSLFAPAFREISKVVTPVWESDSLFTSLAAYTPGGAVRASQRRSIKSTSSGGAEGENGKGQASRSESGSAENLLDPEKVIGEGGSMPVPASLRKSSSDDSSSFLSFGEAVHDEEEGASGPAKGSRIIASFRYNPKTFSDPNRELMVVDVPVPISAVERRSLTSFTSDGVLRFIQQKLASLHSQLKVRGGKSENGPLSLVQFQKQAGRIAGEEKAVEAAGSRKAAATESNSNKQCHEQTWESSLVGFLADQLDKDLKRNKGTSTSYLELGHLSLPTFSAGAFISRAMRDGSADTVVAVQMPEAGDDSHLNLEGSTLDFSRPISIGHM